MRHVEQICDIDCGIAVIAMLADIRYRDAAMLDDSPHSTRGLSVPEFKKMLDSVSPSKCRESKSLQGKSFISEFDALPIACAVLIRNTGEKFGHWIAKNDTSIHDPELRDPATISQYPKAQWDIVRVIF